MRPATLAALCTVLAAMTAHAQPQHAPLDVPPSRQHLVWLEPASTLAGLAVNLREPGDDLSARRTAWRVLALSGGYSRALSSARSLTAQVFVADRRQGCGVEGACGGSTSVRASVGLLQSFGGAAHRGPFLEPRLILGYTREHGAWTDPDSAVPTRYVGGFDGFSAQAGLDVGYQWQLGHFYVAPMLGLAVGASYNMESQEPFLTGNTSVNAPDDEVHLAMGLNLHLLRVGWTF